MAELSVQIGADIQDLLKKLNLTEKEFKKVALEAARSGKTIEQVLKSSGKSGKQLEQGAIDASKGVKKLGAETRGAVPAMTSFSQVIQDAPFGIRGVANNITQLTAQMGHLTKNAGGTKNALKAMLGTLAGPAGILLAVSAVTSLMVSYGDKLKFAQGATSGLAKATKEYLGEAKSEIIVLKQLVDISRDEANSKEVRQGAIDEINKNYSKYLGNLDLESVKTDAVTASVKALSLSLIQKAKIQGLEALISEKTTESAEDLIDAEIKRSTALKRLNSEVNKAIKGNALFNRIIGDVKGDRERLKAFVELTKRTDDIGDAARQSSVGVRIALDAFKDSNQEIKDLNKNLDDSIRPLVRLQEQSKKDFFGNDILNIDEGVVEVKASLKEIEKRREASAKKKKQLFKKIEDDINADILSDTGKAMEGVGEIYEKSGAKLKDELELSDSFVEVNLGFKNIIEIENRIKELSKFAKRLDIEINLEGLSLTELDEVAVKLGKIQDIKRLFNREGIELDIDLGQLDLSQLDNLQSKLNSAIVSADIASSAIGSSFSALGQEMAQGLSTGVAVVDAFVGSIISSLTALLAELIAQQIAQAAVGTAALGAETALGVARSGIAGTTAKAQGVQIATSAAAALGPAGVFALPGLLAAVQAQILGALTLAKGGSFAQGGFTGTGMERDETGHKVAGVVHDGEYVVPKKVLRQKQGSHLVNQLEGLRKNKKLKPFASGGFVGNSLGFLNKQDLIFNPTFKQLGGVTNNTTNSLTDGVVGEVILRGNTQVIQLRRSEKRMKRNFNS